MAEYLSIGPEDPPPRCGCARPPGASKLPDIDELDNPSISRIATATRSGPTSPASTATAPSGTCSAPAAGRDASYDTAIKSVLQIDTKQLTDGLAQRRVRSVPADRRSDEDAGLVRQGAHHQEKQKGDLNVGPELSPDGSRLIYFSEKDLFSIDLFVADARTGEVIRKITNTATNSHYESLSFLTSAGAWDAAGKRFVFPGISKGEAVLTIVDVDRGRTEREIRLSDVHEVINPAWSPDGKQIAFSGLIGGFTDLYVYDLARTTRRAAAADDRRLRRDGSGLVARRQDGRLQHRSVHHESRDHQARASAPGPDGRRDWCREASWADSPMPRTSARSGRPMAARSTSSRIVRASRTSTAPRSTAGRLRS